MNFMKLLNNEVYGNSILVWGEALLTLIFTYLILVLLKRFLIKKIKKLEIATTAKLRDLLVEIFQRTKNFVLFLISLYFASLLLQLPGKVTLVFKTIALMATMLQIGIWANYFVLIGVKHYVSEHAEDPASTTGVALMSLFGRILVWSFIVLLILDNLGVNITTLIASLGVGGIAIGLAVQNILGDLFASLSIILDKPFEVGHFVIVDQFLGTVERIGLKTTRVRSLSGELLIFGNNDLLKSRIRNYKHFWERRVAFAFGVLYSTPSEKLKKIPAIVKEVIENVERTRFDRAHFKEFADFSLNFEIVYYILTPDYTAYMDIQQAINLGIFEAFEKEGIGFAFPTQTVHVFRAGEK